MSRAGSALSVLAVVGALLYPMAVYLGLQTLPPRHLAMAWAAVVLLLLGVRLRGASGADLWVLARIPATTLGVLGVAAWLDDARALMAVPVFVNVAMLGVFGATLRGEVTMIARFARATGAVLDGPRFAHCRQATVAWCVFFAVNASLTAGLAAAGQRGAWALWTGLLAYVVMGGLFAGEFMVRRLRFREFGAGPADQLLRRVLTARPTR